MDYKFNLHAPWPDVVAKIKETNIHITDEDLIYSEGKEEELLERLEKKMGLNKMEIKHLIESISFNKNIAS